MLLLTFCFLPILGTFLYFFISFANMIRQRDNKLWSFSLSIAHDYRWLSLFFCVLLWLMSLFFWLSYNSQIGFFQYFYEIVDNSKFSNSFFHGIGSCIGLDGISLLFVILTTFIFPICIIYNWDIFLKKNGVLYLILLLCLESILLFSFIVLDVFLFYIFFEIILIPMFLIILFWGSRSRKIKAAYYFFFFTLIGSLIMLLAIITLLLNFGSTSLFVLYHLNIDFNLQLLLWFAFFCSFSVKIPMFPFHLWLPEAHVEAPTIGSVILAGILLKLGGYGFLRFSLPIFQQASEICAPFVFTLSILGIFYASFTAIRQIDLKRIIAYSSIAHMAMVTLGLFSFTFEGIGGAIFLMFGHGLVSSALFLLIGVLYDRYHTRLLHYYGGLTQVMPLFSLIFFYFILANVSFPGTINFISEFLVFFGLLYNNFMAFFFASFGILFCAIYSFWLYNRVMFGDLKIQYISYFLDINFREFFVLFPIMYFVLIFGIYPSFLLDELSSPIANIFFMHTR